MKFQVPLYSILLSAALSGLAGGALAQEPANKESLSIVARFNIGGNDTGYDFLRVDEPLHRLYVAHGNRVEVIDLSAGKKLGEVGGMHGVHGIELIPALEKGYTTDGLDQAVTVFDRRTLAVKGHISPTGIKPDAIQYDPRSARLYVVNGGKSGNVTVVDPTTDRIETTMELRGGRLEQIGFDERGHGFVNDEEKSIVHVFDTSKRQKMAEWPLAPCEEPTGLAVDNEHHRLFSACGNHLLVVLDTDSGRLVAKITIGGDPDGVVYDPLQSLVFVSNREGTLDVIRQLAADQYKRLKPVSTGPGARTLAIDHQTGRIYVPTVQFGAAPTPGGRPPIITETFAVLAIGRGNVQTGKVNGLH